MNRKTSYFSPLRRDAKPLIYMEGVDCDSLARVSRSTGYQNTGVRDAQTLQSQQPRRHFQGRLPPRGSSHAATRLFQFVRSTRR